MSKKWMKVSALILVMSLMMGLSSLALAQDETSTTTSGFRNEAQQQAYELITGLGVFANNFEPAPNKEMSAEDFHDAISTAVGYYIHELCPVANYSRINAAEAMREMVILLGYQNRAVAEGDFPVGYLAQALKLKLFKNLPLNAGSPVTYADCAQMIYNALNVELLQVVSKGTRGDEYQTRRDETFMTMLMGISKVTGQITANNLTGIRNTNGQIKAAGVGTYGVEINSHVYGINTGTNYVHTMMGRYVDAYYFNGRRTDLVQNDLTFVRISSKEDSYVIDAEDVIGYVDDSIEYTKPDSDKSQYQEINKQDFVIFNGETVATYDENLFDLVYGSITVVTNPQGFVTIIVKKFVDFGVSGVDLTPNTLYNKFPTGTVGAEGASIVIDSRDQRNDIFITDVKGNPMAFEDIRYNDILSIAMNTHYFEVVVCRDRVRDFVVSKVTQIDDEITITSDEGVELKLSHYFARSEDYAPLRIGEKVTILLNKYGDAAWISLPEVMADMQTAFVVQGGMAGGVASGIELKLFTKENKMIYLTTTSKVIIDDATGKTAQQSTRQKYSKQEIFDKLNTYFAGEPTPIRYRVNAEGLIDLIELPLKEFNPEFPSRLHQVFRKPNYNYDSYKTTSKTIAGQFFLTDQSILFVVPPVGADRQDEDRYSVKSGIGSNDRVFSDYPLATMYSSDPESIVLDIMVLKKDSTTTDARREYSFEASTSLVVKTGKVMAADGVTELTRLICTRNGAEVVYDMEDEGILQNAVDLPHNGAIGGDAKRYTIQPGDIIRVAKNTKTGYVKEIHLVWRDCEPNSAYTPEEGFPSALVGTTGTLYTKMTWTNAGKAGEPPLQQNPYATAKATSKTDAVPLIDSSSVLDLGRKDNVFRVMYGWAYSLKDGLLTVTNLDLSKNAYDFDPSRGVYTETYNLGNFGNRTLVELSGRQIQMIKGDTKDILTYESVGHACSRVLMMMSDGNGLQMYIINDRQ